MPLKGIGKPNMGKVKTGFRLMGKSVPRGARPQKPTVRGAVATNHPITAVRGIMGKARGKKMY